MATRRSELDQETKAAREVSTRFKSLYVVPATQNKTNVVWRRRGDDPRVLFCYFNDIEEGFIHPALAVLGGMMRDHSIEHELFDTSFWRDKNSPLAENARQIRERMGEFKKVEGYNPERQVVDISEKFREHVERFRPDLIALTATSYEFNDAMNIITPISRELGIPVIVGGPHASIAPDRAIKNPGVDTVCIGEGELPLLGTIRAINQGRSISDVPGLWIKDRNSSQVLKNPRARGIEHMDDLPLSDWDMFDSRHRTRPFEGVLKNYGFVEISRGCPFKCSYCIQPALHEIPGDDSDHYKFHSAENIVSRVLILKNKYGFNHIQLIDENLPTMPEEKLREIADLWIKHVNPNRDTTIFTMSRPEYLIRKHDDGSWIKNGEAVSSGKAEMLKSMGVEMVAIGAESGNEWLRENILRRPMAPGIIEAASKVLRNVGIKVSFYNIIGFPEEDRGMILETIDQLRRTQPEKYSVRFLTPYPGTPIRDYCVEKEYIEENYEETQRATSFLHEPVLQTQGKLTRLGSPHPTKEELLRLRSLFGIYAYSTSGGYDPSKKEMKGIWKVIELAEDRGLAKGHADLQNIVYESFVKAKANNSEDDDSYRPELDPRRIQPSDVPWADGDAKHYLGHSKALLPVIELAAGRGYAQKIQGLGELVRKGFRDDYYERKGTLVQIEEKQNDRVGIMMSA